MTLVVMRREVTGEDEAEGGKIVTIVVIERDVAGEDGEDDDGGLDTG